MIPLSKRKAAAKGALLDGLKNAHAEGQGVWALEIYHSGILPRIMLGAALGHPEASQLAEVVKSVLAMIHNPVLGAGNPALCLTCDTPFTSNSQPPEGIVVVSPASPGPSHRIVSVLCEACYARPDVKDRVLDKVRWGMIPDAREIQIGAPGHA